MSEPFQPYYSVALIYHLGDPAQRHIVQRYCHSFEKSDEIIEQFLVSLRKHALDGDIVIPEWDFDDAADTVDHEPTVWMWSVKAGNAEGGIVRAFVKAPSGKWEARALEEFVEL